MSEPLRLRRLAPSRRVSCTNPCTTPAPDLRAFRSSRRCGRAHLLQQIIGFVTELTDDDVREMKRFLTDTCTDVKRWLPEPEWCPGWQSEAAAERGNDEQGSGGPWGPDIVRSVYVGSAMFLEAVLQCMRAMAASITVDTTHYVPDCLARAAMEAGSQAFWLLEPGIGPRRRAARFMLIQASGARLREEEVARTDPGQASWYGQTPEQAAALAAHYGLACEYRRRGRVGEWRCEGEKLPGYTARNRLLEDAMLTPAAYSIYSAALHADWHSVTGNWTEVTMSDGTRAVVISPHRVAVWGAVLVAAAPAIIPAARALRLLDHRARLIEVDRWRHNTLNLTRRMDLPRKWWQ
jgi:hypothetical protein